MTAVPLTSGKLRTERWRLRAKRFRGFARRYGRSRTGVIGFAILVIFAALAIFPGVFVGPVQTATTASGLPLTPPDSTHLLGTDEIGRDVFNLVVHGARVSLFIGIMATVVSVLLGTLLGIMSGFIGGRTDAFTMRLSDFFLVVPTFVIALILAPIVLELVGAKGQILGFRVTLFVTIMVIGITSWAGTARIIRSQTLSLRERAFVDRARVIGGGRWHIMARHVLPNVGPLVVANTILTIVGAIWVESALAFIGLGDPFQPSWGTILYFAQQAGAAGAGAWWYIGSPGVAIVLVVLAFTLVGNALDETLNPRLSTRR
jgi:peptide/nickel transport system permease protein